jgi:hypothetical protein
MSSKRPHEPYADEQRQRQQDDRQRSQHSPQQRSQQPQQQRSQQPQQQRERASPASSGGEGRRDDGRRGSSGGDRGSSGGGGAPPRAPSPRNTSSDAERTKELPLRLWADAGGHARALCGQRGEKSFVLGVRRRGGGHTHRIRVNTMMKLFH